MTVHRLLVIDDSPEDLEATRRDLVTEGYSVETAQSGPEALKLVEKDPGRYAVVVLDFDMRPMNGADVTKRLKKINPDLFILIFSGVNSQAAAVLPIRQGATSFVNKAEGKDVFLMELKRLLKEYEKDTVVSTEIKTESEAISLISSVGMTGCSKIMARAAKKIISLRDGLSNLLILGETGTGKGIAARALHHTRPGRLITKNCGHFRSNPNLARSEFFGHTKGSYTSAIRDEAGALEEAENGTVNVDEGHHLPLEVQVELNLAVESKTAARMGTSVEKPFNCRILTSAKPLIFDMVEKGTFLEDFFERISRDIIRLPKLSQCPEDIPYLVEKFSKMWAMENGEVRHLAATTIPLLQSLPWSGNARELLNVVSSSLNLAREKKKKTAGLGEVEDVLVDRGKLKKKAPRLTSGIKEEAKALRESRIMEALRKSSSLRGAARMLGVDVAVVSRFVKSHGINYKEILGTETDESSKVPVS